MKAPKGIMLHTNVVDCSLHICLSIDVPCFFCGQAAGNDGLHEVTTFQVNQRVSKCAELTGAVCSKLISGTWWRYKPSTISSAY